MELARQVHRFLDRAKRPVEHKGKVHPVLRRHEGCCFPSCEMTEAPDMRNYSTGSDVIKRAVIGRVLKPPVCRHAAVRSCAYGDSSEPNVNRFGDLLRSKQVLTSSRMASQQELQQFGICFSVETANWTKVRCSNSHSAVWIDQKEGLLVGWTPCPQLPSRLGWSFPFALSASGNTHQSRSPCPTYLTVGLTCPWSG